MFLKFKKATGLLITSVVVGLFFAVIFASSASAYGQCGGAVSNGSQVYKAWQKMGVVPQAEDVVKSAGFHRMDGSLKSWLKERVVKAKLASSASPVDYGCQPGSLFSVGNRLQAKGTPVLVALPHKYAKTDVRTTPHKGYKRVVVKVHIVAKTDCSNPEAGVVSVVLYVKVVKHPPKKCKCKKHHKKPKCSTKSPSGGGGNCNTQVVTVTPKQECEANNHSTTGCTQTTITVVANCSNVSMDNPGNVNQGGNCNNGGTETCVGQENCNTETPPPPCGCKPEEPKKPPVEPEIKPDKNQEFEFNETAKESPICATARIAVGATISAVYVDAEYGSFVNKNHKAFQKSAERFCTEEYKAPSSSAFRCTEPGLDASAEWCDLLTWTAEASNGTKKSVTVQVPLIKEHGF